MVSRPPRWRSCVTESSRREVRRQTGIEAEHEEADRHFAVVGVDDARIPAVSRTPRDGRLFCSADSHIGLSTLVTLTT